MESGRTKTHRTIDYDPDVLEVDNDRYGFDVTCVIGRVDLTEKGDVPANVAAFMLIASHDAPGHYSFPMPMGGKVNVAVDYEYPPERK